MRATVLLALALFVFMPLAFASVAEVLDPIVVNVGDNETISLGTIGPGQTIDIVVNGAPTTGGNNNLGGRWDVLKVIETPSGWQGFDSKELAVNMKAAVKAAPDAPDGIYKMKLRLLEYQNRQGLGSVTFNALVTINKNVLSSSIPKTSAETGVEQPARYPITIENKGSASDVFEIYATGIPTWNYRKALLVPRGAKVDTFYEIVVREEDEYHPNITIVSTSSGLIRNEFPVQLTVKSDVLGDIRATKNGVLIFPLVLEPLYSLLGILGHLV